MAREWTPDQLAAINEREKTLLVSAAAGSGKTATLTERIIRTLTDGEHPGSLSRMLVVTFTRASAADLKNKIAKALGEAMASAGAPRRHLSEQLLLLPGAHISTIDSFCVNLVRENASRLGLSPAFRMADNAEVRLLHESVMSRLIEDGYEGSEAIGDPRAFRELVDCLTDSRGDKSLSEKLLRLYQTTGGFARSYHCVADMAEGLRAASALPPFETPWGQYIRESTIDLLESYLARYAECCAELSADEIAAEKYLPAFEEDLANLRALRAAMSTADYTAVRDALSAFPKPKLGTIPAAKKSQAAIAAHAMRNGFFERLGKQRDRFFAYTAEEWAPMLTSLSDKIALLGRFLVAFGESVWEEKRRRGLCDFHDIEHGALRLLYDEKGNRTPLAAEIASRFDYVYVDEYQDVNEVQHMLFEGLSQPRGRFMVGDVKQSIYGFRGAQPEIFAKTRRSFPRLAESGEADAAAALTLSANFRSDKPILDFVNMVFGGMMEGVGEHIGYDPVTDGLCPGIEKAAQADRVTVAFFEKKAEEQNTLPDEDAEHEEDEERQQEQEESERPDEEAFYVAAEIERLLRDGLPGGKLLCPGDIAILVRKAKVGERFAKALAARGIKVDRPSGKGFFLNPEILLAVSLLNVIDNPRRDIYLAGVLRSPLYGFSLDELIAVRREAEQGGDPDCTLYEALLAYAAAHLDFQKGERFLAELAEFRRMAEGMPIDRLIWQLYRATGLLSIAGADKSGSPEARRANLMLLYDYARRFEATSFRGLYNFIDYINEVISRDESIEEGRMQSNRADTVRIMTMHQSKGLEFPVCFVVGAGGEFDRRDASAPLLLEGELGCALKLRDQSGFGRLRNPVYNAIGSRILEKQLEEEMRVLYVALTRPYHKLYVTGTVKKLQDALTARAEQGRRIGATEVYACKTYADMLLLTMREEPFCELVLPVVSEELVANEALPDETSLLPDAAAVCEAEAILAERFAYEYPDRHLGDIPSKLSVSRLYPGVLDEGEEEPPTAPGVVEEQGDDGTRVLQEREISEEIPAYKPALLPHFLGGEREDAAARAGTATHLFMQFCDFASLAANGAEAELARLLERQFISPEDAALVRLKEITAFCHSPMLSTLTEEGGRLYRELRFHVRLPAAAFTETREKKESLAGESVLVQGVMDAVLCRADGSLWLIDYKTDRLTREEKQNPAAAAQKLCARHGMQLSYYAAALREMFGRLPDRVLIYSLALGDAIELPQKDLRLPEG
ncbi:MAG: UvrD-helicase domain-containing protein [Clostridia bacterium]|nr:UvrD-helicase domain-containing protein [Clostridia bacterium]